MSDQASTQQQGQEPSLAQRFAAALTAADQAPQGNGQQQVQNNGAQQVPAQQVVTVPAGAVPVQGQQPQGQAPVQQHGGQQQQNGQGQVPGQQQNGQGQDSWLTTLPPEAQEVIRSLRAESASYRTRLRDAEARVEQPQQVQQQGVQQVPQQQVQQQAPAPAPGGLDAEAKLLRFEVAAAKAKEGFPVELALNLVGGSREELERNADTLLASFRQFAGAQGQAPGAQQQPDFGGGQRGQADTGEDMNALIRRAAGRS